MKNKLILIAAMSKDNVIGFKGDMPWGKINDDLKHFKESTSGHPMIMGSKTYESIGRNLEGRTNIILSRRKNFSDYPNVFDNLPKAINFAFKINPEVYIIGGEELYKQTIILPEASRLEITQIPGNYLGDTFFPKIDKRIWKINKATFKDDLSFFTYERIN